MPYRAYQCGDGIVFEGGGHYLVRDGGHRPQKMSETEQICAVEGGEAPALLVVSTEVGGGMNFAIEAGNGHGVDVFVDVD